MQEQAKTQPEEKRIFKLVVSNASEAVALIQKKFGTHATVQSVKQHQPKGVTKLWSNPKLEIIVSVPKNPPEQKPFKLPDERETQAKPDSTSQDSAMPDIEEVTRPSAVSSTYQKHNSQTAKVGSPQEEIGSKTSDASDSPISSLSLEDILIQSEFDRTLVQRIKNMPQWASIDQKSAKQGLTEIVSILRDEFNAAQNRELGTYCAFIGSAGVGKSTIMQKTIANRVFVHGKKIQILKLDNEDPNPDDMLSVFCQVIGVDLLRDPNELKLEKNTEIYVDLPGVSARHPEKLRHFKTTLDELKIDSRVLVLNSLYDNRSLTNCYEIGRHFGATHQTFTHLDELENWAKLWKFVLQGSYPLIFMNMGEDFSAAPRNEFLPLLVSKTFPKILLN